MNQEVSVFKVSEWAAAQPVQNLGGIMGLEYFG